MWCVHALSFKGAACRVRSALSAVEQATSRSTLPAAGRERGGGGGCENPVTGLGCLGVGVVTQRAPGRPHTLRAQLLFTIHTSSCVGLRSVQPSLQATLNFKG